MFIFVKALPINVIPLILQFVYKLSNNFPRLAGEIRINDFCPVNLYITFRITIFC